MTMSIENLRDVIIKCAGGDADALPVDQMSVPFEELGYDSLVLIETSATLKREYGVVIPDEQLTELRTPAELLLLINDQLVPPPSRAGDIGDNEIAPVTALRELALAAAAPAALRVAVRIGVAEELGDTPVPVDQLAKTLKVDAGVLERLLRNLSCYGIFADTPDGVVHTSTSALLREEHPQSLKYWVQWVTEPWAWELWPYLEHAVRCGGQGLFEDVYGAEFFAHLHKEWPESTEVFNRSQTELSRITSVNIADTLNLRDVKTIADVGGGRGYNLAALLEANPHLEGVLVDLPAVVANPDPRLRPGGALASRARVMAGDCLKGIPVEAEVYLFKSILEWDDERTVTALRNAVAAGRPGGKVLVITNLVDDSPEARYATGIDLLFLLNTYGKRHTMKGITRLVERSGLHLEGIRPIKPLLHLVEASIPR